jgi:hypothetical protein
MVTAVSPDTGRAAYTIHETALALGVSDAVFYGMVAREKIKPVLIGGKKFIPASLLRVLAERE